jgi:broad specificity phosphatase PhoE
VSVAATTVLWARHGENHANLTRTLSHRVVDRELTEAGRGQARALVAALADVDLDDVVFTSPLRRARETAQIVADATGQRIVVVEDFRELDVGELDGRSDATAWQTYDSVLAAWRSGRADVRFPGGESGEELAARLRRGLSHVTSEPGSGARLVVAHGANLRSALPGLAGVADPGHDLPLAGYATLEVAADDVRLVVWP